MTFMTIRLLDTEVSTTIHTVAVLGWLCVSNRW